MKEKFTTEIKTISELIIDDEGFFYETHKPFVIVPKEIVNHLNIKDGDTAKFSIKL